MEGMRGVSCSSDWFIAILKSVWEYVIHSLIQAQSCVSGIILHGS